MANLVDPGGGGGRGYSGLMIPPRVRPHGVSGLFLCFRWLGQLLDEVLWDQGRRIVTRVDRQRGV